MTIKLHDLKPAPGSKTARTRVGRGEGSKGKTAGRGTKGTKARKNVTESLELGQPHVDGHLPTLESGGDLVPGLGALGTAAGRLALGGLATAEPLLRLVGAGGRPQVMQLQHG